MNPEDFEKIKESIKGFEKKFDDPKILEFINKLTFISTESSRDLGLVYVKMKQIDCNLAYMTLGASISSMLMVSTNDIDEAIDEFKEIQKHIMEHFESIDKTLVKFKK